ncbi:hypothetical protein LTR49_028409, partial [Elasticomyces elasticus]
MLQAEDYHELRDVATVPTTREHTKEPHLKNDNEISRGRNQNVSVAQWSPEVMGIPVELRPGKATLE